jgi:hypothetical protein
MAKIKLGTGLKQENDSILTKEDKFHIIDHINNSKIEPIIWIVGIGVLQFVLSYMMRV